MSESHRNEKDTNDVVVRVSKTFRLTRRNSKLVIVLVVIALGILGSYFWYHHSHEAENARKQETATYQAAQSTTKAAEMGSNNSLVIHTELGFLDSYSASATKSQLYNVYSNLAGAYINSKDFNNALKWQLKAISNASQVSYSDYYSLASIYDSLGDKANALKYYQLALTNLKGNQKAAANSDNQGIGISQKINGLEQ